MSTLFPVILSGGTGSRLWPMSRAHLPKQLLPLASERSMLQETVSRLVGLDELASPTVVCNSDHRFMVAEQLREIGVESPALLLESVGRNTAPAIAVAAYSVLTKDADGLMLVLPADHLIQDRQAFHLAISQARVAAEAGLLVTFGIVPNEPETGFGYIQRGVLWNVDAAGHLVERFVEKPDRETALSYLESGDFFWNSGMFVFRADRYLEELEKHRPDIAAAARLVWETRHEDLDFCRLGEAALAECPSASIDYAVMEQTDAAAVVPVDMGWSDLGSWTALWQVADKDIGGNVALGDALLIDTRNSYVRADSRMVAVIGMDDVLVVETADAVLVAHKDKAQDVKQVVDYLHRSGREEHLYHTRVFRPWGWYEGVDEGERFQVKRIMVNPGEKLSLQMHYHRAEHWVVVQGTARITSGDDVLILSENESTYIPLGVTHRLENPGRIPLHIIEVQSGSYLGEDDIVRFEDVYQR